MGHKNRNHNYTNYSKPQPQPEPVVEVVEETVVAPVVEEPVVTPDPEPEKTPTIGVVTGCAKLNVRENASLEADVVCEILANTEVMIDEENSTNDFYKVCTCAGVEGFCMKKFITIK